MSAATKSQTVRLSPSILLSIGALAMLGPVATDIFLPALPDIASEFEVSADRAQLALSATTVGMAVGQLVSGPLADALGRRGPLLFGNGVLVMFAVVCALSPQLWTLVVACFLMGLGGSTGATVGRALISDVTAGRELTRGFALLGVIISLGPIIAPVVGVALMIPWGWRGIFVGLAVGAAAVFLAVAFLVPETLAPDRRVKGGFKAVPLSIAMAAKSRSFWCGAITVWAAFAASFAYIASSSYVLQVGLGFSPTMFAVVFGINGIGLLITGLVAARLANRFTDHQILGIGVGVLFAGTLCIITAGLTGLYVPWLILPGFFLLSAACGLYIGPGFAVAVRDLRSISGTALALAGSVQFLIAAMVAPLSALGGGKNITALSTIVTVGSAIAMVSWFALRPSRESTS